MLDFGSFPRYLTLRHKFEAGAMNLWMDNFLLLKQRSQSTGKAGFKKIKEGIPYFDFLDDVMGHHDNVDPSKMAIEGSSTFPSEHNSNTSPSPQLQESVKANGGKPRQWVTCRNGDETKSNQ